jgi:hypothetical protein
MNLRTFVSVLVGATLLTACSSTQQSTQTQAGMVPQSPRASVKPSLRTPQSFCYGTEGVEATPCPVKLNKKDKGTVTVSVDGPGVVYVVPIASDCIGSGSVCNLSRDGSEPTQFVISSVRGENRCGRAWVVFEGVTASGSAVGTATVDVVNKYC